MSIIINSNKANNPQIYKTSYKRNINSKTEDDKDNTLKIDKGDNLEEKLDYNDKKTLKYVLVGDVIKVFLVSNGGEKKELLKTIPVLQASPEILTQCENITLMDIISIMEKQEEEKHGDDENMNSTDNRGTDTSKASKGVSEYLKHDSPQITIT